VTYTARTTELEGVNRILATASLPSAAALQVSIDLESDEGQAQAALEEASKALQGMAWSWNTEYDRAFSPGVGGVIDVGADIVRVSVGDSSATRQIALRGSELFDIENNTNVFSEAVYLDVVRLLPFDSMPEAARNVAIYQGAELFLTRLFPGSDEINRVREAALRSMVYLKEAESEMGDYNLYRNYDVLRGFLRPWHTRSSYSI
jgi:hypothetical protein